MVNGVEFEFPKPEEINEKIAKELLRIKTESWVMALMGSRKPDEIRESLDPNHPGVLKSTMRDLQERAAAQRLVVAKAQTGSERLPIGFASTRSVFETDIRRNTRRILNLNPVVRELVKITPVVGQALMQKPALELEPVHIDPEHHDDDWLLMELGMLALGPYDKRQQRVGFVPYIEVIDDRNKTHFLPEDTLQPRVMHSLGFEINPLAEPHVDITTLGALADPLIQQPYGPKLIKNAQ